MKLETGLVISHYADGIVSKIISKFLKSPVSHSSVVISVWDVPMVFESNYNQWGKGVFGTVAVDRLQGKKICIRKYKGVITEKLFATKALSLCGQSKYDFGGLLRQLILKLFGVWIKTKKDDNFNFPYCSEYVAWCFDRFDSQFRGYYRTDPKDLYESELFETIFEGIFDKSMIQE